MNGVAGRKTVKGGGTHGHCREWGEKVGERPAGVTQEHRPRWWLQRGQALATNEVALVFGHMGRLTAKDNGPVEPGLVPRLSWSMHCAVHTVRAAELDAGICQVSFQEMSTGQTVMAALWTIRATDGKGHDSVSAPTSSGPCVAGVEYIGRRTLAGYCRTDRPLH